MIGTELAVSYMEELYPVVVGSVDATSAVRPGQRADALMGIRRRARLRQAGARTRPSQVVLTQDGQAVDGRYAGFTMSPHEECAIELAVRSPTPTGGQATVLTLGPAEAIEQLRDALARGCSAAATSRPTASRSGRPTSPGRSRPWSRRTTDGRGVRPGPAGQRRLRHRRLPGRHPARLRARAPGRQRRRDARGRRRVVVGACRRSGRTGDLLGPDADGRDRPRGRGRARATRR